MNWGNPEPAAPPRAAAALRVDTSTGFWRAGHEVLGGFFFWFGSVSKPCTPGEPQNSWYMDVHPTKNGINRYWSIPICWTVYLGDGFLIKPLQPEALDFKPQAMDRLKETKHLKWCIVHLNIKVSYLDFLPKKKLNRWNWQNDDLQDESLTLW